MQYRDSFKQLLFKGAAIAAGILGRISDKIGGMILLWMMLLLAPLVSVAQCPRDAKEWERKRTEMLARTFEVPTEEDKMCLGKASSRVQSCMARAFDFSLYLAGFRRGSREHSHDIDLGRRLSNQEYFEKYRDLLEVPRDFNDSDFAKLISEYPEGKLGDEVHQQNIAKEKIEAFLGRLKKNRQNTGRGTVEWLFYESTQPSIGVKGTYNRLLILLTEKDAAGRHVERWIQFSPGGNLVGVITVVEKEKNKFESYFKDNLIGPRGMTPQTLSKLKGSEGLEAGVRVTKEDLESGRKLPNWYLQLLEKRLTSIVEQITLIKNPR